MIINNKSKRIIKLAKQHKLYTQFRTLLQLMYRDYDNAKKCGKKFNPPKGSVYYKFLNAVKNEDIPNLIKILLIMKQSFKPKSEIGVHNFKTIFLYKPKR